MDQKLDRTLRSLPREEAGPGFTAGVLRRVAAAREPARRPAPRPWRMAMAALAVLILAVGARIAWRDHERRTTLAHLEALRAEQRQLAAELAAISRLTERARPVVYLGGDNDLDLVLDLSRLPLEDAAAGDGYARIRDDGAFRNVRFTPGQLRPAGGRYEPPLY